jgi:intracellular sulfur oxidation DsrE/DsrF family protein
MTTSAAALILLLLAAEPAGAPEVRHPLIQDYGAVVEIPGAAEPPRAGTKAMLDLTSDEKMGDVLKGLDRAAAIVNLYEQAGEGPSRGMKFAIAIHGPATKYVLHDEAYASRTGEAANPNAELLRRLKGAGVDIYVCGQALARQKIAADEVAPDVDVAVSAAVVHINKQRDGYVLIP